ncbi:MAG: transposase [Gammaproteobacteria bacterium]|nr:transposase [Gammaproteobacteria bacterium]
MVNYRRNRLPGGTFFFTVTLADRSSSLLTEHIGSLRQAFLETRHKQPFSIDAIVILPEHLHTLWILPAEDADFMGRWRSIKARFSRLLAGSGAALQQNVKGEYHLWQRRYWDHTIRDDQDRQHHADHIHYNPVNHGLVDKPTAWPYSSIHQHISRGLLTADWATSSDVDQGGHYGE